MPRTTFEASFDKGRGGVVSGGVEECWGDRVALGPGATVWLSSSTQRVPRQLDTAALVRLRPPARRPPRPPRTRLWIVMGRWVCALPTHRCRPPSRISTDKTRSKSWTLPSTTHGARDELTTMARSRADCAQNHSVSVTSARPLNASTSQSMSQRHSRDTWSMPPGKPLRIPPRHTQSDAGATRVLLWSTRKLIAAHSPARMAPRSTAHNSSASVP